MQTALVCLCVLSTAFSTPVPLPLPGRVAGNCLGQHRILLKGCNDRPGFYVFKYIYSFSTRRNQTQIKKEEADSQSTISGHRLGEDNARQGSTEDGAALERDDHGRTDAMENVTGTKTENHSAPGVGWNAQGPHPGTGTRGLGGVGASGPTLASLEGSGDLNLVVEVDSGASIVPQGGHSGETVLGNSSGVRSEDRDDGAPKGVPMEGLITAGSEKMAHTTEGVGGEGSGEATVPGQEGVMQVTGTGDANLTSVTEKMEDVQVAAEGVDEYTYIPSSGSTSVTRGKAGRTGFTQSSPDEDDEVNIFIGRANIRIGEQETTQPGDTVGSEDDGTVGTSSPLPRLAVTVAREGEDDDGTAAHRQPEGPATTATPSHGDRVTSRPGNGHPIGDDEDGATTVGDGEGLVAPVPWRGAGGHITVPTGTGNDGDDDDGATTVDDREGLVTPGPWKSAGGHITVPIGTGNHREDDDGATTVGNREGLVTPGPWKGADGHITVPIGTGNDGDDEDGATTVGNREGLVTPGPWKGAGGHITVPIGTGNHREGDDGATAIGDGEDLVTPRPWRVAGGHITVPTGTGNRRNDDDEVRGEDQRFKGRPGGLVVTMPRQGVKKEATTSVPAKKASIRPGTTMASPGASEDDRTTAPGTAGGYKAGKSAVAGSRGSGEVRPGTSRHLKEGQPGAGVKGRPGGARQVTTPRTTKAPSLHGKASSWASTEARTTAGGLGGNAGGPPPPAGRASGSVAAGRAQEGGQGGEARAAGAGAGGGRLPGHHGRKLGAGAPRMFTALGRSRQVDQVKRADELHVRERAFYSLGPHSGPGSADSSQSSEGERGSRSDSRQHGLQPSRWGGHPYGRWSQGTL